MQNSADWVTNFDYSEWPMVAKRLDESVNHVDFFSKVFSYRESIMPLHARTHGLLYCALLLPFSILADDELPEPLSQPNGGEPQLSCPSSKQLNEWFRPIDRIQIQVHPTDGERMPMDCSTKLFAQGEVSPDNASEKIERVVYWSPTNLAFQPLYFDDVPLERYGQSIAPPLQPLLSGARFFGSFPLMAYKIGVDRPHDPVYTLGYYRPGSPTPCLCQRLPWEWDAAVLEAGSWVGLLFLLP